MVTGLLISVLFPVVAKSMMLPKSSCSNIAMPVELTVQLMFAPVKNDGYVPGAVPNSSSVNIAAAAAVVDAGMVKVWSGLGKVSVS